MLKGLEIRVKLYAIRICQMLIRYDFALSFCQANSAIKFLKKQPSCLHRKVKLLRNEHVDERA